MMKRILVPLTGRDVDRDALDAAFALARPFAGHVEGIFVRLDPRDAVPMLGEGMSGALIDEIMRTAETDSAAQARAAAAALGYCRGGRAFAFARHHIQAAICADGRGSQHGGICGGRVSSGDARW